MVDGFPVIEPPEDAPGDWQEFSLFEQLSLLPPYLLDDYIDVLADADLSDPELMLRPQQLAVVKGMAWIEMMCAGRGAGKELALDTAIPTPTGWLKMGELSVGDIVLDEQGRPTRVLAVYDNEPHQAWKLTFSDGTYLVAGGEHQWVTHTALDRKRLNRVGAPIPDDWAVGCTPITTAQMVETLTYGKRGDRNHSIPVTKPLKLPAADLPVDPWVLGVWLGDGSSATAEMTCHDDDAPHYVDEMAARGIELRLLRRRFADQPAGTWAIGAKTPHRRDPASGRMISNDSVHSKLRSLGVLANKHIPASYLRGSAQQRLDLLRGLVDTDGHVSKANGCIEFCTTKRVLADGVVELARSLGQKPVLSEGVATLNGRVVGPKYRVTWRPTMIVATLPRKVARHRPIGGAQSMRHQHRMLVSAEPVEVQPMRCITVDSPNSMYLAGDGMIPTHNTRTGAHWVIERAKKFPGCRFALLGRTVADVRDVMISGESGIMACSPDWFMPTYVPSLRKLEWPNGSVAYTYSSDAPSQLRGPQQHFTWADELAAFNMNPDTSGASAWDNALLSTRLGEHPQILITTTPKRTAVVRDLFKQSRDPSSGVVLYQASTLANRANLSAEYIASIYARYEGSHLEQQELHGELIGDSPGALWRSDDFTIGTPPEKDEDGNPIPYMRLVGVDPSVKKGGGGDDTGIIVVQATKDADPMKRRAWVLEDITMNGGPDEWAKTVVDAQVRWSRPEEPAVIVVEGNQGGALLSLVLNQIAPGIPVAIVNAIKSKSARAEPVVMAYRQGRVKHVEVFPELVDELTGWEPDVSRWSPGHLDALVWALHTALVDQRPLYPFIPIVATTAPHVSMDAAVPKFRKDRKAMGMNIAPWRKKR